MFAAIHVGTISPQCFQDFITREQNNTKSDDLRLTEGVGSALTGSETNTSSGGVSREPSAAAYTTANTKVLSQSTSKTGRHKRVQGVWTQMGINYTNGAQVNYGAMFIFIPLIIQPRISANKNSSPSIYKCTFTFDRFFRGVEVGTCDVFLFLQSLLDNRQSRSFILSVIERFNFREHSAFAVMMMNYLPVCTD